MSNAQTMSIPCRRRWHGGSTFGPGRRVPLDRNARARFAWLVRADRRHGRLSASGEDVGLVLLAMLGDAGQLDPAHATIAARVGCHVATVRRCLDRLRDLGRITWGRRLRRDQGTGWRAEQTSCAFVLNVADCDTHRASEVKSSFKKERTVGGATRFQAANLPTLDAATAREALAAVRDRRQAAVGKMLGKGSVS